MSRFSGGERARAMIARLMLATADVLLLDEPTNDLDIPTLEVLEDSLLEFSGAIVLVSHDRYLLDRVSTVVIGLDGGERRRFRRLLAVGGVAKRAASAEGGSQGAARPPAPEEGPRRKLAYLEQREWDGMEAKILEAERELAARQREIQEAASGCPAIDGGLRRAAKGPAARGGIVCALGGAGSQSGKVKRRTEAAGVPGRTWLGVN